jgi:MFS transporter, DHA2 family, multidrug resistance protein
MKAAQIIIIATAALAALLEILDSSIVNVAIPTMMGNLGVTLDDISWVTTGYMIANSIVLPIAAWLGMRLGRRTYFTGAILAFTVTSLACGLAPNLIVLTFFRILQGLAGGALLPTSQTLIQEQFPREKAGMATAIFGLSVMVGPALGPTLGGYLTDQFGWRSIFNVNVPFGIAAATMSWMFVTNPKRDPSSDAAKTAGVDWTGLGLLCLGVGCFQFVLERGDSLDWFSSPAIRVCAVLAAVGICSFVWWELQVKNPIMNLRLYRNPTLASGTVMMLMIGVLLYSVNFVIPIFVDNVVHMTATQTGMLFIPGSVAAACSMIVVGTLVSKMDPRLIVLVGIVGLEMALLTMSHFTAQTGAGNLWTPLIIRGATMGCLFIPINGMVLSQFRGDELGQASGLMNFSRQIGGSIGIASLSTLLNRYGAQNYRELANHVTFLNTSALSALGQRSHTMITQLPLQLGLVNGQGLALKALYGRVMGQVFLMSFNQLNWTIMVIFALSVIPLATMRVPKKMASNLGGH